MAFGEIELRDVLLAKGYDVKFLEIPEGHSLNAWSPYIDDALTTLLPAEQHEGGQREGN